MTNHLARSAKSLDINISSLTNVIHVPCRAQRQTKSRLDTCFFNLVMVYRPVFYLLISEQSLYYENKFKSSLNTKQTTTYDIVNYNTDSGQEHKCDCT